MTTSVPAPNPGGGAFDTSEVLPWGRNRIEYGAFFDLVDWTSPGAILDCGGGPSSFTAEMTALGHRAVAADPLYRRSKASITAAIDRSRQVMMDGLLSARDRFLWHDYGSPEGVEATRLSTMKFFLKDYDEGRRAGRYLPAALPDLPFADDSFALSLVSHLLLLYSAQLDLEFHLTSAIELLRVAPELRVFPLLDIEGHMSCHLVPLAERLRARGYGVEVRRVAYEFQKGGNRMLRVTRA